MAFESQGRAEAYWNKNVKLMITLMVIWFSVSFGCGILFVDQLNQFHIGGYKLGFWFINRAPSIRSSLLSFSMHGKCDKLIANSMSTSRERRKWI